MQNLTLSEQKLLQKYGVWEILQNYWQELGKLAENNEIDEAEKITKWQSFLEQVFDETNLKAQFENQILQNKPLKSSQSSQNPTSQSLESSETQNQFDQKSKSEIQENSWQESLTNQPKTNLFDNNYWIKTVLPQIEHPQFTRPKIWTINLEKLNSELSLGNFQQANSAEIDEEEKSTKISENIKSENSQNLENQNEIQSETQNQITNSQNKNSENLGNQTLEFKVPDVLLGGNHLEIAKWRQNCWKNGN